MNNSLVTHLSGYVEAVFKDIAPSYTRARELERDKSRLLHELRQNGLRVLAIDLPALLKHFQKCLEEHLYFQSNLRYSSSKKGCQVPVFMQDLYLQIFHQNGVLRDQPSVKVISVIKDLTQLLAGLKKADFECKQEAIEDEVKNFLSIEEELYPPSLLWDGDELFKDINPHDSSYRRLVSFSKLASCSDTSLLFADGTAPSGLSVSDTTTLQQVCDRVASALGDFHIENDVELPKHGKGRVSNHSREVSKYHFSQWPWKLDAIFPYDLYARTDFGYGEDLERDREDVSRLEHPSKLIAVPKTLSGPRLIASEPNQYQWIQQLIRYQLDARIKQTALRHCVELNDQRHNQILALSSSFDRQYATVDLKSASDRLSAWTIERAFRSNLTLLERLHASRSRTLTNCVTKTSFRKLSLKKAFTQGSGCNFHMQSISYAMFAIAAVLITTRKPVTEQSVEEAARNVRVYGDDIIVPVGALVKLTDILTALQLKVNSAKTFSKGHFRESCGCDAYFGVEITPVYIRKLSVRPDHQTAASVIDTCNNLYRAGLWNTADWLQSTLSHLELPVIQTKNTEGSTNYKVAAGDPSDGLTPVRGFVSFCGSSLSHLKSRWNSELHRVEHRFHSLHSKPKKTKSYGTYNLFQYFIEKPSPLTKWEAGVVDQGFSTVMRRGFSYLGVSMTP